MTTIELVPDGYEAPESNYQGFSDGKYKIKGFDWFTRDDNQRPILVSQKDGKLVGRFRLTLVDGNEGPPMSVSLNQMPLLAKAFGVDVKKLPPIPNESQAGLISQYMTELQTLCNTANKTLDVEVSKGWVNTLPGMSVPQGYYYFRIVDITGDTSSGELKPNKSKKENWLDYFYIEFEVVAGEGGQPSPYSGARFSESLSYAFKVVNDKVIAQKNEKGEFTGAAARITKFVKLTAPNAFVINFNPPNVHNLLPYMRENILKENKVIKGSLVKDDKSSKVFLSWSSLEEAIGYQAPKRIIDEMNVDDKCRQVLVEALDKLTGGQSSIIPNTMEFSEAGRVVAKEYLAPIRKDGLITHSHLDQLTPEEITTILTVLQDKVGEDFKNRVVALGVGIEIRTPQEVEEDSPF